MGPRTRASALAGQVYSSPTVHQQLEFKPRKRTVKVRHSLGAVQPPRQETLTQMDFVNLQSSSFDEEEDAPRKKKRRRTDGDAETPSSTYHTQTLTQIDFVSSTPAVKSEDGAYENISDELPGKSRTSEAGDNQVMGPPKTPIRRQRYEIPSSQSPVTPLSNYSQRYLEMRSPLTSMDTNARRRVFSPSYEGVVLKRPVLEIRDSFDVSEKGSQAKDIDTVRNLSVAIETAEEQFVAKSSPIIKHEIQDSDEEYEYDFDYNEVEGLREPSVDELKSEAEVKQEICNDEHVSFMEDDEPIPETQLEDLQDDAILETQLQGISASGSAKEIDTDTNTLHFQSDLTDTQEAEQQLNSTILQFTQMQGLNHEYTPTSTATPESELDSNVEQDGNQEREGSQMRSYIRPSQATTVAESSPPPLHPLPPHHSTPVIRPNSVDDETQEDYIEDIEDDEDDHLVTMIPDSPAHTQPRKHHHYHSHGRSSSTTQSLPPLPFSLASSQLLTRSQMLPESLMNDSVPPPPRLPSELFVIEDSDIED